MDSPNPNPLQTWAEYVRVSGRGQKAEQQEESNANFFRQWGITGALRFSDVGKRHRADKREDFQRLEQQVSAGQVQNLLVSALDRWGFEDAEELLPRVKAFRKLGCRVWEAKSGRCVTSDDDATLLINVIEALASKKEQWTKSDRDHKKKVLMTLSGQFTGGPVPYGFDLECRSKGQVVWRFVAEGLKTHTIEREGKPHEVQWEHGTLVKDGVESPVEKKPSHDHRIESTYLAPSIREERLRTVARIFEWYATESVSVGEIADRLNREKIPAIHSDFWYRAKIWKLLRNPTYQGIATYYKTTSSQFYRFGGIDEATGARLMTRAPSSLGAWHQNTPDKWLMGAKICEPMVSASVVESVQAKINSGKRPQSPRNQECWLSGIVVCATCGKPMRGRDFTRRDGTVVWGYRCSTFAKLSPAARKDPTKNLHGCRGHSAQHDVIERCLLQWFADEGPGITEALAKVGDPESLQAILENREGCHSALHDTLKRMSSFVLRSIQSYEPFTEIPSPFDWTNEVFGRFPREDVSAFGEFPFAAIYDFVFDVNSKILRQHHANVVAEFESKVQGFASLKNERARTVAEAELARLDAEIKKIEEAIEPLNTKRIDLHAELQDLDDRIRRARVELEHGTNRQKAEAVRKTIAEIRLGFTYTQCKSFERSHLESVTVVPMVGTGRTYRIPDEVSFETAPWPRSSRRAWPPCR